MLFCQAVVGPPGSGKTTYCASVKRFLQTIGRQSVLVNLDPGNEAVPLDYDVDIRQTITLESVMQELTLGPNGAMVICMEMIEKLFPELFNTILAKTNASNRCRTVIFDFPGQAELYTHCNSVKTILSMLETYGCRVVVVNVVDSQHCLDAGRFVSVLLMSLNCMLRLAMPLVNVLSKMDLVRRNEQLLAFDISYYANVLDLKYLLKLMPKDKFTEKHKELTKRICEVVEDYSLVNFHFLESRKEASLARLMEDINKVHGYADGKCSQI